MRILIFSLAFEPYIGGAEVSIREITDRIADHEFDMITLDLKGGLLAFERIGNVNVHRLTGGKYAYMPKALFAAIRMHRARPYDLVWSMMASFAAGPAYWFKVRFPSVPLVLSLQEGDPIPHIMRRVRWVYPFFRDLFRRADYIQTLSNYLADFARSMGARGPVVVVPNGVDIERFDISADDVRARTIRAKFDSFFTHHDPGSSAPYRYLITTSRLVEKNGVEDCIRALAELPRDVRLVIVGTGLLEEHLKRVALELDLGTRVLFAGEIANRDLPAYLAASDIFVRPSLSEGLGISFLEAMAVGLPVIATNVGGIPDFLEDGVTGLACAVKDPHDLAMKIRALIDDPARAEAIARAGRQLVRDKFRWDDLAAHMRQIFELAPATARKAKPAGAVTIAAAIYPPAPGGPALHAKRYFEAFAVRGVRTNRVVLGSFGRLPFGVRHAVFAAVLFAKAIRSRTIYAMDALSVGVPALVVARLLRRTLIVRIGGDVVWERAAGRGLALGMAEYYRRGMHSDSRLFYKTRRVLAHAQAVIVPTRMLADLYATYYGVSPAKIHVIPNPIPEAPITRRDPERSIVFASRLVAYKNLAFVLDSLARIAPRIRPFSFIVCGDGPERESLERQAQRLGLADEVQFRGTISEREVEEILSRSMLAVAPALTEFNPNYILRAKAYGVPFLISAEHGLPFAVPQEMQFDPTNAAEFEEKVVTGMTADGNEAARRAVAGIDWQWSWNDVIRENLKVVLQ